MSRENMWKEFVVAGEWGLKEEFRTLKDEEIRDMTPKMKGTFHYEMGIIRNMLHPASLILHMKK